MLDFPELGWQKIVPILFWQVKCAESVVDSEEEVKACGSY
jgi:hypothetical protein